MTWIGAFLTFILTVMIGFPALIGAAVFGELMGERDLHTAIAEHGVELWQLGLLVVVGVLPNLLSGLFSGGFSLAVAHRLLPAAEVGAMAVAASAGLLLHLLAAPLLFPEAALMPKAVQVTGALIAYAAVAMAVGELDDQWRVHVRRAWMVLLIAAMIECAVQPLTILQQLETVSEAE